MDGKRTAGNPAAGAWGRMGRSDVIRRHSGGVSGGGTPAGSGLSARGETVLVVKSGPEEAPCVVGGQVEESIRPGEVWISVAPGAGIRLTKEGTIQLQGRVEVEGSLWLQGQEVRG